jgi:hypothetical protein
LSTSRPRTATSRRPGWSRAFFDPIELPDARRLATLKDAAEYVTNLPTSEHDLPPWRAAVAALILSAEHGESGADPMLAQTGMMRALHAAKSEAPPVQRKKAVKKYKLVR